MNDMEFAAEKIRSQYVAQKHTELDVLKALDAKVKRPARVFGYAYGTVGAIVMGAGMSLVMTDIGAALGLEDSLVPGINLGVVGMVVALTTWPIYKRLLASRKKQYASQIMALSERIVKGGEGNV
jgi:hypothetical protein